MNRRGRIVVLALLGVGIGGALALRHQRLDEPVGPARAGITGARLIELGSTSCRSCKAMHDELAELRTECGGSIAVEEIDVWRDEDAARRFAVRVIPTQVFVDGAGRELDRHVGFLARADIRARFAAHGLACLQ
jgi:thioredoxin 1